jgi:hypothetical protein
VKDAHATRVVPGSAGRINMGLWEPSPMRVAIAGLEDFCF